MKYGLCAAIMLLFVSGVQAADYRIVYSPSQALEVYIDNVSSSDAQAWCRQTLPVRIVAGKSADTQVLNAFLPQVGNLLQSQCTRLLELPWQLTNSQGSVLASGSALKEQSWRPIVTDDASATADGSSAAPLDLSPPASREPLPRFALPSGCHFRTGWRGEGGSLFIPDDSALRCNSEGWLEGHTTLQQDNHPPLAVTFIAGYPLAHLQASAEGVQVVTANVQRVVLARRDAPDSWLLLPFSAQAPLWSFDGILLVKSSRAQAADEAALKKRLTELRQRWAAVTDPAVSMTVLLVDDLHADLADPAIGAWRSINSRPASSGE